MAKSSDILEISGVRIETGRRKRVEIPVAHLFDSTKMSIPVEIIRGKENGSCIVCICCHSR